MERVQPVAELATDEALFVADSLSPRAPSILAELYLRYRDDLVRYVAFTFGQGPPEPEDVAQATFVQFAALDGEAEISNARALLYRIARNHVLDQRRRLKVRAKFAKSADVERIGAKADELTAERVICAKERLTIILRVIGALPTDQREIVILSRLHEFNNSEIARRCGVSEAKVRRVLASAMAACQLALQGEALAQREQGAKGRKSKGPSAKRMRD